MIPVAKLPGIKASNGKAWGKWLGQGLGGFLFLPLEMTHRVSEKWSRVRSAVWYKLRHGDMILKKLEMRIEKCGLRKVRTKHWEATDCREFDQGSWVTRDCRAAKSPCMLRLVKSRESSAFPTMVAVRRLETPIETDLPGFARICQDSTVVFGKSLSALWPKSTQSTPNLMLSQIFGLFAVT